MGANFASPRSIVKFLDGSSLNESLFTDRGVIRHFLNIRAIRVVRVGKNYPPQGFKKTFKKSEKKACQPMTCSIKRGVDATNRSGRPFKKTLKKVKKKLVSVLKI
jgi:hypothetical protein